MAERSHRFMLAIFENFFSGLLVSIRFKEDETLNSLTPPPNAPALPWLPLAQPP